MFDYGTILHFLDAQGAITTTVTYDRGQVSDPDSVDVTVPLGIVISNTAEALRFIRGIRGSSTTEEEGYGHVTGFDIQIKFTAQGTITLEETDLRAQASDDGLDFEWSYDQAAETVRVEKVGNFDIGFAAYVSHVDMVQTYLDICKSHKDTKS